MAALRNQHEEARNNFSSTTDVNSSEISLPAELEMQLKKAKKKIADLLEDVGRLSDELQRKDSLLASFKSRLPALSSWLETTQTGDPQRLNTTFALKDTVVWDPSTSICHRPSCSTPSKATAWSEVVVRNRRRAPGGAPCPATSSFTIPLSNQFSALAERVETQAQTSDQATPSAVCGVSPPNDAVPTQPDTGAFPPHLATAADGGHPSSSRPSTQRRRLLRDAVKWHSRRPDSRGHNGEDEGTEPAAALQATTLIIGDSIVRNVRLRGALTLAFPGATVSDVAEKIPDVLHSHPQVKRVIIHAGTNDTSRQQSELLKRDFMELFKQLSPLQLNVFISGPTPTCGRGVGRFSRLLSLNTWLSSACSTHSVNFIDNFDVFWERRHLFGSDGLHLNRAGTRVLSTNLEYGLLHARFTHYPTPAQTDPSVTD